MLQVHIHQLESDLGGMTEEVKSAKAGVVSASARDSSLLQVQIQLDSGLETRTEEVKSAKDMLYKAQR